MVLEKTEVQTIIYSNFSKQSNLASIRVNQLQVSLLMSRKPLNKSGMMGLSLS